MRLRDTSCRCSRYRNDSENERLLAQPVRLDISLSVDRLNKGAIALYEQHGFHQVDETDDSLTLRAELA